MLSRFARFSSHSGNHVTSKHEIIMTLNIENEFQENGHKFQKIGYSGIIPFV